MGFPIFIAKEELTSFVRDDYTKYSRTLRDQVRVNKGSKDFTSE